jgi:hypothetical protein
LYVFIAVQTKRNYNVYEAMTAAKMEWGLGALSPRPFTLIFRE